MRTLYLPVASVNLAHYFARAVVCSSGYIDERNEDIQSHYPDILVFCTEAFIQDHDCALEIVLNDNEADSLIQLSSHFYGFTKPLPISRVKKVLFIDERQYQITKFNIEAGSGFLPVDLILIEPDVEALKVVLPRRNVDVDHSWQTQIDRFDKVLGGCALVKLSTLKRDSYPFSYFAVLSYFNHKIADDIKAIEVVQNSNYDWVFAKTAEESAHKTFHQMIYQNVTEEFVIACAEHEGIILNKRLGKYSLNDVKENSLTYSAIIMHSYGATGARMSLDNFISDLFNRKFPASKIEPLALTFGINKGYSAFRNHYNTEKFECDIKFRLDSQFDYYVIESIYQFVFNGTVDNQEFSYIDSWCPKYRSENKHANGMLKVLDKIFVLRNIEHINIEQKILDNSLYQDEEIQLLPHEQDEKIKQLKEQNEKQDEQIKQLQQELELQKEEINSLKQLFSQKNYINYQQPLFDNKQDESDLVTNTNTVSIKNKTKAREKELNKLKKAELQLIAEQRELNVSGLKKAELIEVIIGSDKELAA